MKWVTRQHPKTDRIACPSLIRKFIDPLAEIVYDLERDEDESVVGNRCAACQGIALRWV